MRSKRKIDTLIYQLSDFIAASIAWACFFIYRKVYVEQVSDEISSIFDDPNFWKGIIIVPILWILFYGIFDNYKDIYRLSRLATLARSLLLSFVGVIFLFFTLILDDVVPGPSSYLTSFLVLFALHFLFTSFIRMIILTRASKNIKLGKVAFNTLIIGSNLKALELYLDISNREKKIGNNIIGFVDNGKNDKKILQKYIPFLGNTDQIDQIIKTHVVEEVIVATQTPNHEQIRNLLNSLFGYGQNVIIKIIPDMYDILLGHVKMNQVYGAVLIEIKQDLMPRWQVLIKRLIDIITSAFMLLILSPLYFYIILRVRASSEGPIFFKQTRIGQYGKPFHIYKFRSMYIDAEATGPQLSIDHDPRCTPWGAIMRKWRLDELPQFWNVIKGNMSLVGPRPERQFYINQIINKNPHYKQLLKVRPGITSWGQVKYGYASNVDEMLQRLKFDLLYIENMSLALDFKILFYTALVLLQGKGK